MFTIWSIFCQLAAERKAVAVDYIWWRSRKIDMQIRCKTVLFQENLILIALMWKLHPLLTHRKCGSLERLLRYPKTEIWVIYLPHVVRKPSNWPQLKDKKQKKTSSNVKKIYYWLLNSLELQDNIYTRVKDTLVSRCSSLKVFPNLSRHFCANFGFKKNHRNLRTEWKIAGQQIFVCEWMWQHPCTKVQRRQRQRWVMRASCCQCHVDERA